jgi:ParB family chromosome partitioning protein
MREPRLGRGLAVLLGQTDMPTAPLRSVPLDALEPSPFQPRGATDPVQLAELTASIRQKGVLQPVLAREVGAPPRLQLVAGERRWRAAREAGLSEIPCLVQNLPDEDAALVALVENLQRQDLGALEEADGFRRMIEQFGLRQEGLALAIGKSRSHVANTLRLLNLPDEVQTYLREGKLTAGHARALLAHADPVAAAHAVIKGGLNVRQTEALTLSPGASDDLAAPTREVNPDLTALETELSSHLGLRVTIADRNGAGRLTIQYRSLDQLDGLIALLRGT